MDAGAVVGRIVLIFSSLMARRWEIYLTRAGLSY